MEKIDTRTFGIQDYLLHSFQCSCGKVHHINLKEVNILPDALENIPAYIEKYNHRKVFFIFDRNTYSIAGQKIEEVMAEYKKDYTSLVLEREEVIPDEGVLGSIMVRFDNSCDLIIGVGSGTINDICKLLSYQMSLEYYIVATAPSMDGFASPSATVIVNGLKAAYETHVPEVIIADLNIIKDAPIDMIEAGVSDILGKYTSLCDWKISSAINGEYYCDVIADIVRKSIDIVSENIHLVHSRHPKAIGSIMEGLILNGIAMNFAGNSRPVSGSEHQIVHYWEMLFMQKGKKAIPHGIKVGIASVAVLKAYELVCNKSFDFKVLLNIEALESKWEKIIEVVKEVLPPANRIVALLKELKAPCFPDEIGIDNKTFIDSIIVSKELTNRYGLLQMLSDLNIAEKIAKEILIYYTEIKQKAADEYLKHLVDIGIIKM